MRRGVRPCPLALADSDRRCLVHEAEKSFGILREMRARPACQATVPGPAIAGSRLPGVSVASGIANDAAAPSNGARGNRKIKTYRPSYSPRKAEFCNTISPKADIDRRDGHVRFVPKAVVSRCSKVHERKAELFDHLVGGREQLVRHGEAEGLRHNQVNDEVELGRLLDRDISRLGPAQNLVDIVTGASKLGREARP